MKRTKSREKIGRNDLCWCGSGKKYKKCHLGREDKKPIAPWQTDQEFKRLLEQRQCLAPGPWKHNCSPQISRAHTVPRSGSLARIARDGHVYAYQLSLQELQKTGGTVKPQLVGINRASTFTGFCSEHGRSIFAPWKQWRSRRHLSNASYCAIGLSVVNSSLNRNWLLCWNTLGSGIAENMCITNTHFKISSQDSILVTLQRLRIW